MFDNIVAQCSVEHLVVDDTECVFRCPFTVRKFAMFVWDSLYALTSRRQTIDRHDARHTTSRARRTSAFVGRFVSTQCLFVKIDDGFLSTWWLFVKPLIDVVMLAVRSGTASASALHICVRSSCVVATRFVSSSMRSLFPSRRILFLHDE